MLGAEAAAADADIVFLCVPTPQGDDGSADLSYIEQAAAADRPGAEAGCGRGQQVDRAGRLDARRRSRRCSAPTCSSCRTRSSCARARRSSDFLQPDRVVIGSSDRGAAERVADLYSSIDTAILITDPASAETIKYAANGFLAMKISFVNAVAAMCEAVGADVAAVVDGIGSDQRIGRQFLNPGPGWGGSCFPKDSRALVKIAEEHGYNFTMMRGVIDVNDEQLDRMVHKIAVAAGRGDARHVSAISPASPSARSASRSRPEPTTSASPRRSRSSASSGASAHGSSRSTRRSPATSSPHQQSTLEGIELVDDMLSVAADADVIAVFTEWPEFAKIDLATLAAVARAGRHDRRHPQPARPGPRPRSGVRVRRRRSALMRVVVAGGPGFLGSHLCDALLDRGDEVVCVDNLVTGRLQNIAHLAGRADFTFVEHDVVRPLDVGGRRRRGDEPGEPGVTEGLR